MVGQGWKRLLQQSIKQVAGIKKAKITAAWCLKDLIYICTEKSPESWDLLEGFKCPLPTWHVNGTGSKQEEPVPYEDAEETSAFELPSEKPPGITLAIYRQFKAPQANACQSCGLPKLFPVCKLQ